MGNAKEDVVIDATTFQKPLAELAEVIAQKLKRETSLPQSIEYVSMDLHVLMRLAINTYGLLFYVNADERRNNDCDWRAGYSVALFPVIRTLIDCLYNITAILQNVAENGPAFRKSGFKKLLKNTDDTEERYGGRPPWDAWIKTQREVLDLELRRIGISLDEIKCCKEWPTLGKYISKAEPGDYLNFLSTFTYGHWREYSAMAHGGFEGLVETGAFLTLDSIPHDDRLKINAVFPKHMALHVCRAATTLLCLLTEVQLHFKFEGAVINARLHRVWRALILVPEAEELFNERYAALMEQRGIHA